MLFQPFQRRDGGATATRTPTPTPTATATGGATPTPTSTPSVSDDPSASLRTSFNRSNSSMLRLRSAQALGSNWTERAGDLQIYSNTLRNVGASYEDNLASWNGGSYGNVFVSAKVQFSALNGSLTVAGRLGSYSGGIHAAGYAAELLSSGQVKLWRLSDWAQLGSTYTISGLQAGQGAEYSGVTLGLRLNGSASPPQPSSPEKNGRGGSARLSRGETGYWLKIVKNWAFALRADGNRSNSCYRL